MKQETVQNKKRYFTSEEYKFRKLPQDIRSKLIDLSGLSQEEAIEKMKKVFEKNMQNKPMICWDEVIEFPKNIDRGKEVGSLKTVLLKKKTPVYVERFGLDKIKKRRK